MIHTIELQNGGEEITVTRYEGDPVKLQISGISLEAEASLLESETRTLINALVCTLPEARHFIQEGRFGRDWKAKTIGLKKEELLDALQKTKVENLWLVEQLRMRSEWVYPIKKGGTGE